jgi:hypothetical protein
LKCINCYRRPLYDAIINRAPDAVILTLLEANKSAAEDENARDQCHMLHKALEKSHSDYVILALLEAMKKAVKVSDSSGYLPLTLPSRIGTLAR